MKIALMENDRRFSGFIAGRLETSLGKNDRFNAGNGKTSKESDLSLSIVPFLKFTSGMHR